MQQQNKRAAREKRKGKEHRLFSSATRRRKEVERRRIKCLLTLFVQHQAHPNSIDLQELVLQPQFRVVASASLRKQDYLKKKKYLRASPSFGLLIFFFFVFPSCIYYSSLFLLLLFASLLFFSFFLLTYLPSAIWLIKFNGGDFADCIHQIKRPLS